MKDCFPPPPLKASPGYRDGEQDEIARWLAEHDPTKCPGFGEGEIGHVETSPQKSQSMEIGRRRKAEADRRAVLLLAEFRKAMADPAAVPDRSDPASLAVVKRFAAERCVAEQRIEEILRRGRKLEAGGTIE